MKKIIMLKIRALKFILAFTFLCLFTAISSAQIVAIVGYNGDNPDGYTIVALENIAGGTKIYFTDNEYSAASNNFNTDEGVWSYTTPTGGLSKGDVVTFAETGISTNDMTLACNNPNPNCGLFTLEDPPVSLANTFSEGLYAYSDTDNNPGNGVTEIYSVLFHQGTIPSDENPTTGGDFPNAIVVDGFASTGNHRDYKDALRSNSTSKANLENPANYDTGTGNQTLSIVPFTNINLSGVNPALTVSVSPVSTTEDGVTNLVYTFTLAATATSNMTVNFNVGGTATFNTDYTQSGAASFSASSGTVVISNGSSTASITINPTSDSGLEPDETVLLTITSGTGYDIGNPSTASGTITNDDTMTSCPLVAITGLNHSGFDGFSFVSLDDLVQGSFVYFTENEFDNTTLTFNSNTSESILKWTVPAGDQRGDVYIVKETGTNTYTMGCSDGSGATCGAISQVAGSGSFSLASDGEGMYAYADTDDDPTNGISEIYSVLYTGVVGTPGGNIPAIEDPSSVYAQAVVVDGFPAIQPNRTEYDPTLRGVTVSQADFENTNKWLHAQANADLSNTPFSNIIIKTGSANSTVSVTVSPVSVDEDSGNSLVYTFALNGPPQGDFDVSFQVLGTATYLTDYTVTTQGGNSSFNATTGVVTIFNVTSFGTITVTPVADSDLEPSETVILSIVGGAVYDSGSPGSATGTINNDDIGPATCPMVAITGMNHNAPDGFSFVALQNIPSATEIYFTDNPFNNATLLFGSGESVIKWTAPAGISQGDVIIVKETAVNVLSLSCTNGTCGTASLESGSFALGSGGETLYAYLDADNDPTNGVTEIISVLYTGATGASGGSLPAIEDPTTIYPSSIVIDGFPTIAPNRTEFDPANRNTAVNQAALQNTNNWLHAQANADLSTTQFDQIEILLSISCPANPAPIEGCGSEYVSLASSLPLSETLQTITETDFTNEGGSINSGGTITSVSYIDVASGSYPFTVTRTFTITDDCPTTATCTQVFTIDDTTAPTADVLPPVSLQCIADVPGVDLSIVTGVSDNCVATCEVWINELHYDNTGGDVGEFVEVAGSAGTDLSIYSIVFYNGSNGNTYNSTLNLTGTIDDESNGFGAVSFLQSGIQNGSPDGLALVKNGTTVIEFLSYEGTFTANNGPAAGMVSTDMGVSETSSQAVGESLSRNGTGNQASDFTFADGAESPGDLNILQTMTLAPCGGTVTVTYQGESDNSGAGSVAFPLVITRTYKLQDPAGNMTLLTQTITVIDNMNPGITCPADKLVNNDGGVCEAVVSFSATGTDNCGTATISYSQNPGTTFPVGTTNVTATATDASGNQASCTFNVTVSDNTPPVALCQPAVAQLDANGVATITGADVDGGSSDNCSITSMSVSPNTFNCVQEGANVRVILTVTDAAGNTASCSTTVEVDDSIDPVANCMDITVPLDANGTVSITEDDIESGSTDNCGFTNALSVTPSTFDCSDIGANTVTVNVGDGNGNQSTCTATVTVVDDLAPTAICQNVTVQLGINELGSITANSFNNSSTDNCGPIDFVFGNCSEIGVNVQYIGFNEANQPFPSDFSQARYQVLYTAAELTAAGFVAGSAFTSISFNIAEKNTSGPIPNFEVSVGLDPVTSIGDASNTFETIALTTVRVAAPYTTVLGWNEIAFSSPFVWDGTSGLLIQTCHSGGNNGTDYSDGVFTYSTAQNRVISGYASNCTDATGLYTHNNVPQLKICTTTSSITLDCSYYGINSIDFSVSDGQGNTSVCTAILTVTDPFGYCCDAPTIACPATPVTAELDENGMHMFDYGETLVTYTSDCGLQSLVFDHSAFSCADIINNPILVNATVTDINGATASCDISIIVEDNIDPIITCPDKLVVSNDPGLCSAAVTVPMPTVSDNCTGIAVLEFRYIELDTDNGNTPIGSWSAWSTNTNITLPVGLWRVRWRAKDLSGNKKACNFRIEVKDEEDPAISCPASFSVDTDAGVCSADIDIPLPTATDNCDNDLDFDFRYRTNDGMGNKGSWSNWMTNTNVSLSPDRWQIQWRATDDANNKDKCKNFFITVEDSETPVIDTPCPENITLCGAQNVSWTPPTATDNCAVVTSDNNYDPGDYFDVGTYNVTYTFYDAVGLSVSCSFVVTINPLPEVIINQSNLPTWCQGIKVLNAKVANPADLTFPLTFAWSDGLGGNPTVVASANGTYYVTVTDDLGCSSVASTIVNVDISTLLSAHTIIAEDAFEMSESTVLSGGVGVLNGEEVTVQNNTDITTFLRSGTAFIDGSSTVANYINSNSPIILPAFLNNSFNDNNDVYVPSGGSMTLSGSNYGNVTVGKNATLTIDNGSIYLKSFKMLTASTLIFNQSTNMMVKKKVNIGLLCNVNVAGPTTVIYAADNASVNQGSVIEANIYAPEGLDVNDGGSTLTTQMTGLFIGNDRVSSNDNVIWGWNLNCSYLQGGNIDLTSPELEGVAESINHKKDQFNVYPNPTSGILNIDLTDYMEQSLNLTIYNTLGEVVWSKQIDGLETTILNVNLSGFANGLYYLSLTSNGERISKQIVLNK